MTLIVVADDDPDIRDLVSFKLEQTGFDVVACEDGAAALAVCEDREPDLVILDVMMPGMSGLDVCRSLRDSQLVSVPVILLTARAQESDIAQGFEAGADDYVIKPFSPRELSSRVQAVLQRSRR
jgi:DNA-binding response OmpR family regulator